MRKYRTVKGFTLLELLVVIVILSVLMSLMIVAGGKAFAFARSAKCKNHLKNLQQAVFNFSAMNGGALPRAGSYEYFRPRTKDYVEMPAWIRWQGGAKWPNEKPQRDNMRQAHFAGDAARNAIEQGQLWSYVRDGLEAYSCPEFSRQYYMKNGRENPVYRSYAMNEFFDCERNPAERRGWSRPRFLLEYLQAGYPSMGDPRDKFKTSKTPLLGEGGFSASRMMLFGEIALSNTPDNGGSAKFAHTYAVSLEEYESDKSREVELGCDGVFNPGVKWLNAYKGQSSTKYVQFPPDLLYEAIGQIHGSHGNAVFMDGHVESLTRDRTWWAMHSRSVEEQAEKVRVN